MIGVTPPVPAGGRVLAVGVDLVDVERVRESLKRFPERFARRVLSEGERVYCLSRSDPAPHVAARFAAKEAVIKCLGGECALNEIEVVRALSGSPSITLHGRAKDRAGSAVVLISLTHLDHLAAAFATLVEPGAAATQNPPALTLQSLLSRTIDALERGGIPRTESVNEARLLIQHAAQLTKESLRLHPEQPVSEGVAARIQALAERRANREPLAYVMGVRDFYGLTLDVSPAVLIPRPETEFVVETVLQHVARLAAPQIADVGVGSGAIAVAVAAHKPEARVWASDISYQALEIARRNLRKHGLAERVHLRHGDLLAPITEAAPFDVIASNPPYIAPAEISDLEPEVRDWEPCVALGVHADALHFYHRLAAEAPPLLKPGGMLVVEVGQGQAEEVAALWRAAGLEGIQVTNDYAGIPRVVRGLRSSG